MASIYFSESNNRWVGKIPRPPDPITGKKRSPKYVYAYVKVEGKITERKWNQAMAKAKRECEEKVWEYEKKLEEGVMDSNITVATWLRKYLELYCADLATTTREGYQRYIENHIIPFLGAVKLKDLRPFHIQAFFNHERTVPRYRTKIVDGKTVPLMKGDEPVPLMKNGEPVFGYSEKTILQEHRILHRAFEKALADGFIARNPCDGVDAPSPEEKEPDIYTEEEFLLLLDKLEGHRMEAIILIAGMCGLRRGELLGLTWEDIDFEEGVIRIERNIVPTTTEGVLTKNPKTKKSRRTITIPSGVLARLKQIRGIGKLYTRLDGKDYHPGSVSRMFKEFLERNGLRHIRLHDLRHFNATMMLKYGVSEREAQERLGHSNPSMTKKYQHILEDMDRQSADKLNAVLK